MASTPKTFLEAYSWIGVGYQPLVFADNWQAAQLNWEPVFDPVNLGEVERHNESDEVFVLWRGRGVLFSVTHEGVVELVDMAPGVIYNVTAGTWHNLVATQNASWIIVENRDTHLHDTETRQMTEIEMRQLRSQLPAWLV
jgi:hypothetical protein